MTTNLHRIGRVGRAGIWGGTTYASGSAALRRVQTHEHGGNLDIACTAVLVGVAALSGYKTLRTAAEALCESDPTPDQSKFILVTPSSADAIFGRRRLVITAAHLSNVVYSKAQGLWQGKPAEFFALENVYYFENDRQNPFIIASDRSAIYVVFQGTNQFCDWFKNLNGCSRKRTREDDERTQIHSGFHEKAQTIPQGIIQQVAKSSKQLKKTVVITGHSLGGGAAAVLTYDLLRQDPALEVLCVTFAAPYVFKMSDSDTMPAERFINFMHPRDIVPVSSAVQGYFPFGRYCYINAVLNPEGNSVDAKATAELKVEVKDKETLVNALLGGKVGGLMTVNIHALGLAGMSWTRLTSGAKPHSMDGYVAMLEHFLKDEPPGLVEMPTFLPSTKPTVVHCGKNVDLAL